MAPQKNSSFGRADKGLYQLQHGSVEPKTRASHIPGISSAAEPHPQPSSLHAASRDKRLSLTDDKNDARELGRLGVVVHIFNHSIREADLCESGPA